ncbi:MAG TPA: GAF domain-containing sensor histidine kinase [Solirubrobacteraceae bacterium]|nr:GAF domain-containing sensor histidine kinase [Solirubrobacteraceae bacterium]
MDQTTRGLLNVARSVLENLDLEVVLRRVLIEARDLTGARFAALGVLDAKAVQLERFLTLGADDELRRRIGPLPTGRGVLGELIRVPRPLRLDEVGAHPASYGFPAEHPPMGPFLGVPVPVRGRPYGNLYLSQPPGAPSFTAAHEEAIIALAELAGVAIDHARRYAGSEAERAQLADTVAALDATLQIARAVGRQTDLGTILELVAQRARELVSARTVIIELADGEEFEIAAGAGALPAGVVGRRLDLVGTVASAALRSGRSQRLSDPVNRDRFLRHGVGHLGLHPQDGLVVPLLFRKRAYGVLVALDRADGRDFGADDLRLLEAFATSAATAVATAESAAAERRRQRLAAAEAERTRWARELHDETLQALGSLRLTLSGARRSGDPQAVAAAVDGAIGQLETDIANLRGLIAELRPAALDQLGLAPALHALVERVGASGLDIDAQIDLAYENGRRADPMFLEHETAIYRIVQEALTNAVKHGHARRAVVEVLEEPEEVRVLVRDDGRGFDPERSTDGFGLLGVRERVELLQGDLTVQSEAGKGTTLSVRVPVRHVVDRAAPGSAPAAPDAV